MFVGIPSWAIGRVYAFSPIVPHKGFVSQANIFSQFVVALSQAIRLYAIALKIVLYFPAHHQPVIFRMLRRHIQAEISGKLALIKYGVVLDDVDGDFPSPLRPLWLSEIDNLHARPAVHLHK